MNFISLEWKIGIIVRNINLDSEVTSSTYIYMIGLEIVALSCGEVYSIFSILQVIEVEIVPTELIGSRVDKGINWQFSRSRNSSQI